jgi:transcriptional regulator with XRE-family HTH domain
MFKDNLKKLRQDKEMTQEDLAHALFVTQQAVSVWETGKGYPDLPTLQQLSRLFDTNVDSLIGVEEYNAAMEEKRMHASPLLWMGIVFAALLALLSSTVMALSMIYNLREVTTWIDMALLLICILGIFPLLILIYRKKANGLAMAGLIVFAALTASFLGLAIAAFIEVGTGEATGWAWLCAFLIAAVALGFFIFWYIRSRRKSKPEAVIAPRKPLANPWAWIGLVFSIISIVLLFVPWGYFKTWAEVDGVIHYYDSYYSPWQIYEIHDGTRFFPILQIIVYSALILVVLISFFKGIPPKVTKALNLTIVILLGCAILLCGISLSFFYPIGPWH